MSEQTVYGAAPVRTKIRTHHLQKMKAEGHKWAMLTAYDYSTARIFDEAGIPVLLVGDSAANVVYGYDTTVPITDRRAAPAGPRCGPRRAARAGGRRPAVRLATRRARSRRCATCHPVHEGGRARTRSSSKAASGCAEQIAAMTAAGIPVMAHIGFTPQSVNTLGGFRVQGRGDAAEQTIHDAIAVAEAGAFAVVMEMVPAELATQITGKLTIPTIGIGAGPELRRAGAGVAGHGRDDGRQDGAVRQALRRGRCRIVAGRNAIRG